jgi:ABC-type multidrug transport system fused ATPase/permease subunit
MKKYYEAIKASASVLPSGDKKKIVAVIIVQVALSFLDLLGVALIGVVGAISITGIQNQNPGNKTSQFLDLLNLSDLNFYTQVVSLSIVAATLLIVRTILSMYFSRKYLQFLSRRSAWITSNLFSRLISQDILKLQKRTRQENLFLITEGVRRITMGILGNFVFLIADISLLLVLTLGLIGVDPIVAVVTFLLFGSVALILHFRMSSKANKLGRINSERNIQSNQLIIEALGSYREILVRNRRNFYSGEIETQRFAVASNDAELAFMPLVSKYVLESAVVVGAFAIAGLQFALNDSKQAIATLTLFIAAGSRIGPAIMRVQQGVIHIGIAIGSAKETMDLISELSSVEPSTEHSPKIDISHQEFMGTVEVIDLDFKYSDNSPSGLFDINILIEAGKSLAIVGSSGAGKSTLVDVILGVLQPNRGRILISGLTPMSAINKWPGAIAYVPQDIALIDGTIRQNITLGFPDSEVSDELIWSAIDGASLRTFIQKSSSGLETQIGDEGANLSGGERQRLGIARALLTNPKLLILDEATSALDGETEAEIAQAIQSVKGKVTVIMIAHRLSTVQSADVVVYLEDGKIMKSGTFNEVRQAIPNFDAQAKLMGL